MSDLTDRPTYRRPLGVIEADQKRASSAPAQLPAPLGEAGRPSVIDVLWLVAAIIAGVIALTAIDLAALVQRVRRQVSRGIRSVRPARRDGLDPAILRQISERANRLAIQKSSTRSDP